MTKSYFFDPLILTILHNQPKRLPPPPQTPTQTKFGHNAMASEKPFHHATVHLFNLLIVLFVIGFFGVYMKTNYNNALDLHPMKYCEMTLMMLLNKINNTNW